MVKRVSRRLLALLLAMIMTIGIAPMPIFAEGETTVDTTEETSVTDYTDFMTKFKQLEIYADEYAAAVRRDAGELVLNFIRTGVERYQDDNWTTLAGQEIIGFTNYI